MITTDHGRPEDLPVNAPLRFRPYLRPMVWGGRRLGEVLGKPLPAAGPYGESWEISDHPSHHSVVAEGPRAGQTLRDLMRREAEALVGAGGVSPLSNTDVVARSPDRGTAVTFPWLVKLLDAWDRLSVQVHPDAEAVRRLWPGEDSKTEAWFVLEATPESRVYAGLLPGVDEPALRAAVAAGRAADCLYQLRPRPGDCLFLPAGTVHAVGGGVLMAEVQQTSDATFRLFDWNRRDAQGRSRELHVEQAMACIDWRSGPVRPVRAEGYPQEPGAMARGAVRQRLVSCRYFLLDYLRQSEPFACGGTGRLQVLIVLHGRRTGGGRYALTAGDTLLLPAALEEGSCYPEGPLGLLVATLPDEAAVAGPVG
jgi:mannose-6-phosphate isomerase